MINFLEIVSLFPPMCRDQLLAQSEHSFRKGQEVNGVKNQGCKHFDLYSNLPASRQNLFFLKYHILL
jgi:hypothetical protein